MKKKYLFRWMMFLAIGLILACQTPSTTEQQAQQPAPEEPKKENPSEPQAPLANPIPPPEAQPVTDSTEPAENALQKMTQDKEMEAQQQEAFIEHLIRSAKLQIARHEYNAAKNFLDQALKLRPEHKEANELRSLVGTFLGEPQATVTTLHSMYESEVKVKIEQAKLEARNHYKAGVEALQKKEYDTAIRELEATLEIIKWAPYQLGLDTLRKEAEAKIKEAQKNKEEWLAKQKEERMQEAQRKAEQLEAEEQAQRGAQVRILLSRATEFYTQQRYDKADAMVVEVLKMDPSNKIAIRLQEDIRDASHAYISQKTLEKRIEEWKLFLEDVRRSAIPMSELVKYPDKDYWHDVIGKRKSESELGMKTSLLEEDSAEIRKIKDKLQSFIINLNFSETPFQDVVRYIQTVAEINIVVDPKVTQKFEIEGTKVNLKVSDIKLQDALIILLQFHDLIYVFKDDVLFITSKASELAKEKPMPVLHDIRDLTGQIKDFPGPRIKLMPGKADESGGAKFEEAESTTGVVLTGEKLTELIKASIEPESWNKEQYSVAETSGQLLVVHTPKVQEEIRNFLNDMRRFSGMMVSIEARFLEITDDFLEHVGVDWRGIGDNSLQANDTTSDEDDNRTVMPAVNQTTSGGTWDNYTIDSTGKSLSPSAGMFFSQSSSSRTNVDGYPTTRGNFDGRIRTENIDEENLGTRLQKTGGLAIQLATLDDTQLSAVLWLIKKTGRAEIIMAPRLTAFNTQRAHLTVVQQQSYIKDFDVEVAQSAYIADPQIGVIQTGVVLDVRPIISNDRRYITLELRPTLARFIQFRSFETSLGQSGRKVNFEMPEINLQSIETTVRIPDQGTLMLGGLKSYRNIDRKQDIPILGNIPIISFFFSQQSKVDEKGDLLILIKAKIIDLEEEEEKAVGIRK